MRKSFSPFSGLGIAVLLSAISSWECGQDRSPSSGLEGCVKDTDCRGSRICEQGTCVYPFRPLSVSSCVDEDRDGYGQNCPPGPDCNDHNASVSPGAREIPCNAKDENCNGMDYCPSRQCVDHDQDGFGEFCEKGSDCDDADPSVNRKCLETMLKWSFSSSEISAPAVGTDGKVYVGVGGGVKVLDPLTGSTILDIPLDCCFNCNSLFSPVLSDDGFLYGTCNNAILKVDVQRGEEAGRSRSYSLPRGLSLDSAGGTYFYTPVFQGILVALNQDLSEKWRVPTSCYGWSGESTTIGLEGNIYFAGCHHLTAFSPSGEQLWSFQAGGPIEGGVALSDSRAYIADRGSISAVDLRDGNLAWRNPIPYILPPIIGPANIIYVVQQYSENSPRIYALNSTDGSQLWSQPLPNVTVVVPVVTAGRVYTLTANIGLSAYATYAQGEQLWSIRVQVWGGGFSHLRVDKQGTIYVVGSSQLWALEGDSSMVDSPWPMHRHDLQNTGDKGHPY